METSVLLLLEGLTFGYDESPLFDNLDLDFLEEGLWCC